MRDIFNHIGKKGHVGSWFCALFAFFSILLFQSLFLNTSVYAAYSATLNTSNAIEFNADPDHTTVHAESVTVVSNCSAGYNLTISTTGDNKLYKNGDSTISAGVFNPVNPLYALSDKTNNSNTWGYSLTNTPNTIGAFNPFSTTTPAFLKTVEETATEEEIIDDTFYLYYGINVASDTAAGSYKIGNNGAIVYMLTMAETCSETLETIYYPNAGSDTVYNLPTNADNTENLHPHSLTLSTKLPVRAGYIFKEWNTSADGTGTYYRPGDTILIGPEGLSGIVDLYAIWVEECASATICFDGNHADAGTMPNQVSSASATVAIIPSNYSRAGYGFAGWNTEPDGSGDQYGPNSNIKMPKTGGVNLFAQWIEPIGTLQGWANPGGLNVGDVIALKDSRDNEVYTVAKLADNNVWITENLRLQPNTAAITAHDTNSPTADFLDKVSHSSPSGMCSTDNAECDNSVQFNTNNINRNLTPSYDTNDNASSWYSYGVVYNWYTATAGNGVYETSSGNVNGDLCPAGWHLPTGGPGGEWGALNTAVNNGVTTNDTGLRNYPVNIIRSGDYNPSEGGGTGRGRQGRMWSATAASGTHAYRMGYSASDASATNKSWNKWDGFNIRCIYQGGNILYVNTNVNFAGSGVTRVTFENPNYETEIATPEDPVVNLAENVSYTITATISEGYELTSWATSSTGTLGSTTENPTTYTVTEEATLTANSAIIPDFTTTVTLPTHVTSVSFSHPSYGTQTVTTSGDTVILKKNAPYTTTATFDEGYTLENWTTSVNGTFVSTTSVTTTYSVIGDSVLSLNVKEAELLTYTLSYDAGPGGSGAPADETITSYHNPYQFTISNTRPSKFGYSFVGWSETSGSTAATYQPGDTINVASTGTTTTKVLYAVYQEDTCPGGKICYFGNGATAGTMPNQNATSSSDATLIPSNYSREGYGFAGWITSENATPYGPNETITTPSIVSSGLKLYAKWIASTGTLQTWNGCGNMATGSVTALTDSRDNNTYTVGKLADGKCWIVENFRLDPGLASINSTNTHNPTAPFLTAVAAAGGKSISTNEMCNTNDSECFDKIQYNANSINRGLTPSHTSEANNVSWYSYGVYYNWYTATAGNGLYSTEGNVNVPGDICPINWHLPTGNTGGEYRALNNAINGGATNTDAGWRTYPNNFIRSGDYNTNKRTKGYVNGRLWTATDKDTNTAYRVGFDKSSVTASNNSYNKWDGFIVRCVRDAGAAESISLTITIDEHVASIGFYSSEYGTTTLTPATMTNNQDGTYTGNITIYTNTSYTITGSYASGYEFASWATGANGILDDSTSATTNYTVSGASTLTLTSQSQ